MSPAIWIFIQPIEECETGGIIVLTKFKWVAILIPTRTVSDKQYGWGKEIETIYF